MFIIQYYKVTLVNRHLSQASFKKVFEPITTKLDDVITSNLKIPPMRQKTNKKEGVPNYGINVEDGVDDMNLGDLFDQPVSPE